MRFVVRGEKELDRSFRQLRRDVLKELRPALRRAAEPIRQEAASLFSGYDPGSAGGYAVRVRMRGVAVEQRIKRTTGLRPDFGSLQMTRALIPALNDHQESVRDEVSRMIDAAEARSGLL